MLVAVATLDREGPEARVSPEFGGEVGLGPRSSLKAFGIEIRTVEPEGGQRGSEGAGLLK